jgi:putative transposase
MVVANTSRYLFKIMHSLKRYTGYLANKILNREGAFWQSEYYDHLIRDKDDFNYHVKYTLENPVNAKIATNWEDWTYTYLSEKYRYIVGPIANRTTKNK